MRRITAAVFLLVGGGLVALALGIGAEVVLLSAQSTPHDSYYLLPRPAVGLAVFGVGLVGSLVLRRWTDTFGDGAVFVQRSHLVTTILLVVIWSIVHGLIRAVWPQGAQPAALVLSATLVLMLAAHGVALAATGMLAFRSRRPGAEG